MFRVGASSGIVARADDVFAPLDSAKTSRLGW